MAHSIDLIQLNFTFRIGRNAEYVFLSHPGRVSTLYPIYLSTTSNIRQFQFENSLS